MKLPVYIFFNLLLLLACISCTEEKKPSLLEFDPAIDSTYHYTAITETKEQRDTTAPYKMSDIIRFSLRCTQKNNDNYSITMVIEGLKEIRQSTIFNNGRAKVELASVAGKSDTMSTEHTSLTPSSSASFDYKGYWEFIHQYVKGDSLQVIMNRSGEVLQVNGFDTIVKKVIAATHYGIRDIREYLKETIGPKTITDLLTQLFFFFPSRAIKKDDNWVKNMTLTALAPVKYSNMISVSDVKHDSVLLYFSSKVSAKAGEGGAVYREGTQQGNIIVSYATGMVKAYFAEEKSVIKTNYYNIAKTRRLSIAWRPNESSPDINYSGNW